MRLFGKIGRRLLAWFLLVALIPILFMGYQGYYFARRAVEQEVFRHMETVAKSKQLAIEQWFAERNTDMRELAATLSGRPPQEIVRQLAAFQAPSQAYAFLCLADAHGRMLVCTTGDSCDNPDSEEAAVFARALREREPVVGPVYLDTHSGPSMQLAYAIRDGGGKPLGIIGATLVLAHTLNPIILDTTGLGRSGQAYLVDEDKVMLTPSRFMNHPKPLSHTMDTEGIRRALSGGSGAGVYSGFEGHPQHPGFAGQPVLGAWAYLPGQRWALIAEMNADEAFAPLASLRRDALIVAVLTLGAILIVVAFISRSISLPIRRLAEASLDVSRGNLDRTVAVKLGDEVGELGERFNSMVGSLRESQRQLVQSERLAAIGELVASVVHEIRNPLSAIKMNLRILESKSNSDPVTAEHFKLARTQTERLESMLSELLDYSKPIPLQLGPVQAGDVIADALGHFRGELLDGVVITTRLHPDLPPLKADAARLTQVLLNLLLNARQALQGSGAIVISAEPLPAAVRITVRDDGQGISPENLQHIFEPFFTTRKSGTGLGLPNARKIIEAHGGQIHVTSSPDQGTEVSVEIPLT